MRPGVHNIYVYTYGMLPVEAHTVARPSSFFAVHCPPRDVSGHPVIRGQLFHIQTPIQTNNLSSHPGLMLALVTPGARSLDVR